MIFYDGIKIHVDYNIIPYPTEIGVCNQQNEQTLNALFWIKPTDAPISQIYFVKKLYMFRAVPLPIIRSFPLYIRYWYMSCRFGDSFQALPGWNAPAAFTPRNVPGTRFH